MKINYLFITLILLISCTNKKEIDIETYDGLVKSIIDINEQQLERNNRLIKNINSEGTKMDFLIRDPQTKETIQFIQPIYYNIKHKAERIDDFILKLINDIIAKEENEIDWFTKDFSQKNFYKEFEKINNLDSPTWATHFLYKNKKGEELRIMLMDYRDDLILTIAGETLYFNNEKNTIKKSDLKKYSIFKSHLEKKWTPWNHELLNIYEILTKPEQMTNLKGNMINWNKYKFEKKPLIGVISTITSLRNDIRKTQLIASKVLFDYLDRPSMLLPLNAKV